MAATGDLHEGLMHGTLHAQDHGQAAHAFATDDAGHLDARPVGSMRGATTEAKPLSMK